MIGSECQVPLEVPDESSSTYLDRTGIGVAAPFAQRTPIQRHSPAWVSIYREKGDPVFTTLGAIQIGLSISVSNLCREGFKGWLPTPP